MKKHRKLRISEVLKKSLNFKIKSVALDEKGKNIAEYFSFWANRDLVLFLCIYTISSCNERIEYKSKINLCTSENYRVIAI